MGIETAFLAPALQVGGAVASGVGAYQSSRGARAAYRAQGQVAENNARLAEWQAEDAIRRGARDVSRSRMKTAQLKGTQRAALAANGVDLGVGSALNILTDTDYFGDVDADTITDNAAREAWAIRNQAAGFRSEADLFNSRAARESPWLAGGTSLLTSAGKVADRWYTDRKASSGKRVPDYPGAEY